MAPRGGPEEDTPSKWYPERAGAAPLTPDNTDSGQKREQRTDRHFSLRKGTIHPGHSICQQRCTDGVYKGHFQHGANIPNTRRTHVTRQQQHNPLKKTGRGPKRTCVQRRHTDGQQSQERMLSVTSHQRPANRDHREPLPHTSQNGRCQKNNRQQALVRTGRKGNPVRRRWECKLGQPLRKTVCRSLKKLRTELLQDPAIPLLATYPNNRRTPA